MPLTTERPLTRRSYQRRMGLAAALPGVALTTRLETGREEGGLVLVVLARREGASLRLGVTNKAASTVGDHLFDVSTTFPDVIAPGDYLSATYARSSRPERFRVLGAQYGAPVGADGLRITLAAAQARSRVLFGLLKGRLSYYSAGVSYPLVQTEALTLAGTLGFDRYDSDNAFIDYRISSDRSRALRLGVQFRHRAPRRALGLDVIWSQGLDIMTARATPGRSQSGFRKVKLDAAFDQQIGPSLYARARATMQATRSLLPDVEILSLGGDTLRGVRTDSCSATAAGRRRPNCAGRRPAVAKPICSPTMAGPASTAGRPIRRGWTRA
jgi:hemolysin activation/secretion protein